MNEKKWRETFGAVTNNLAGLIEQFTALIDRFINGLDEHVIADVVSLRTALLGGEFETAFSEKFLRFARGGTCFLSVVSCRFFC